jgi:hypothetical protein
MHIFRRIFLSNYWWQESDIWSQASYRYAILWEAFLDPSDSYFLFADFVDFSTHWTYMLIFRRIFLSNYWWQKSDIWSQASYRYPILWEAFFHPSDSYFLFAKERGYHRWALAHSSSCCRPEQFKVDQLWKRYNIKRLQSIDLATTVTPIIDWSLHQSRSPKEVAKDAVF